MGRIHTFRLTADRTNLGTVRRDKVIKGRTMDCTIRDKVLYCCKLFKQAPLESFEVQDVRRRFVEWYTNIAAYRVGIASLDERLRDATDILVAILRFLGIWL